MEARTNPNSRYQVDWRGHIIEVVLEEPVARPQVSVSLSATTSSSQVLPEPGTSPGSRVAVAGAMESETQQAVAPLSIESAKASNEDVEVAAVASPMEVNDLSAAIEEASTAVQEQSTAAVELPQVSGSPASLGEVGGIGAEAIAETSAGTSGRSNSGERREWISQQSVNTLVGETGGTASTSTVAGASPAMAVSKNRERDVTGAGTSEGAGAGNTEGARVAGVARVRGRAHGGANAGKATKIGMTLRSASKAEPTVDAQTLGRSTRSMTLRDREASSTAAKARGRGPNGAASSTRGRTVGSRASGAQTAAARAGVRAATANKAVKRKQRSTTAAMVSARPRLFHRVGAMFSLYVYRAVQSIVDIVC